MRRARRPVAPRSFAAAWLLALAAALALPPAPARAAIDGSPHDLIAQGYDVPRGGGSEGRCVICHAAARASGQALTFQAPPSVSGRYGAASLVCFSCHDGITLVSPEVDASLTAFHPDSHGHDLTAYRALQEQEVGLRSFQGDHMECTTCHDPHDNTRRPFLRAPLGELCLLCHSLLAEVPIEGTPNSSGNHPGGRDLAAVARPSLPLQPDGDFTVAFPAPYPLQKGKGTPGVHWDLGGHLLAGASGALACSTCHAVHGDEEAPPPPALLAKDPVRDVADEFCEGCHRGRRGDDGSGAAPNPGGTLSARTYHPCDDDLANGEGRIVETRTPEGWPFGGGSPARLLCVTCHRAHGAQPGTPVLRPSVTGGPFCAECHDQVQLEYHHPTGLTDGKCSNRIAMGTDVSLLSCERCHRAHNAGLGAADERDFVPILRESRRTDVTCLTCHPADDPTCSAQTDMMASHFLGDPGLPDTYDDRNPPIRTEAWPESGLVSLYGDPDGRSILCLSCHSFRKGAVSLSGDDGDAGHLLARAGNPVEWAEGEEAKYLCTGCHGASPGTGSGAKGHTHPLMHADVLVLGTPVRPPASATGGGKMNCDSCHRPHGAVTAAGVYIMEAARGANTDPMAIQPKIDFTPTCHLCHDASKY